MFGCLFKQYLSRLISCVVPWCANLCIASCLINLLEIVLSGGDLPELVRDGALDLVHLLTLKLESAIKAIRKS